jgi:hypothetical protein
MCEWIEGDPTLESRGRVSELVCDKGMGKFMDRERYNQGSRNQEEKDGITQEKRE